MKPETKAFIAGHLHASELVIDWYKNTGESIDLSADSLIEQYEGWFEKYKPTQYVTDESELIPYLTQGRVWTRIEPRGVGIVRAQSGVISDIGNGVVKGYYIAEVPYEYGALGPESLAAPVGTVTLCFLCERGDPCGSCNGVGYSKLNFHQTQKHFFKKLS